MVAHVTYGSRTGYLKKFVVVSFILIWKHLRMFKVPTDPQEDAKL
jgi:hypothetical protein